MSPVLTTLKTDEVNRLNRARSHMDGDIGSAPFRRVSQEDKERVRRQRYYLAHFLFGALFSIYIYIIFEIVEFLVSIKIS